jgi:hypothetical protein
MSLITLSVLWLAFGVATDACADATSDSAKAEIPLETKFVKDYLVANFHDIGKSTHLRLVSVRTKSAAKKEFIAYISGDDWCGSGGCLLLIFEPNSSSFNIIGRTTIVWPPIRMLSTTTNGHPDIGVWVQGGGTRPGYEARLRFNGKSYPGNPSLPPALHTNGKSSGRVVITTSDQGELLFP